MGNPKWWLLLSFFFIIFLSSGARTEDIASCLTKHKVNNFTNPSSPSYNHLFDLSIKNLRFTKPSINSKPLLVIFPNNLEQMLYSFQCSRNSSATIRLRCGGHSYGGFSSVGETPFVVIDMMNLNDIEVEVEQETAWLLGGATLGQVYHEIGTSSNKHAFPASMCPTVGSSGHFSGGGYGALARKCGLAADNVVDITLIEPWGHMLTREDMGEEIFWAIRGGGGGNFGAVVAWKIKLCRVPEMVTAFQMSRSGSPSQMAQLWHNWQVTAPNLPDDFFVMIKITPATTGVELSFMGLFLGPKATAVYSLKRAFPQLGIAMHELHEMTWLQSVVYLARSNLIRGVDDLKDRFLFDKTFSKIKSDFVREPIPEEGIRGALELVAKQPKAFLALSPYGGAMGRIRSDAIAFPHRAGNLYSIEYMVSWIEDDERSNSECTDWLRSIYAYMTPYVSKGPRAAYVNDVDLDLGAMDWTNKSMSGAQAVEVARAWGEKYFLGNYDRLVKAKTLVDPYNVLRHPQSVPPLSR